MKANSSTSKTFKRCGCRNLGRYRLSDLDGPLLRAVFAEIARSTNSKGRPQSPSALNHLRTTILTAVFVGGLAIVAGAISFGPSLEHRWHATTPRKPATERHLRAA